MQMQFQSTRVSRPSTRTVSRKLGIFSDFNPQGSHDPRPILSSKHKGGVVFQSTRVSRPSTKLWTCHRPHSQNFNPQGSHDPRRFPVGNLQNFSIFQSTRVSRPSTEKPLCRRHLWYISIHKGLTTLDLYPLVLELLQGNFNPQGSHDPRRQLWISLNTLNIFQSTRVSRPSTLSFIPHPLIQQISIHKGLTTLDSKNYQNFKL